MAFDGNGQAFQDFKLLADQYITDAAAIATLRSARQVWQATVGESGSHLAEHETMLTQGQPTFTATGESSRMQTAVGTAQGTWLQMVRAYINANGTNHIQSADEISILRGLLAEMVGDSEDVDASVPSVSGTVSYGQDNQGDATATIVVNTDANLKELLRAGTVILQCDAPASPTGAFSVQNEESWILGVQMADPMTGDLITRYSPSTRFKTGTQYEDVIYSVEGRQVNGYEHGQADLPRQVPQRGNSIMTGLVINIAAPDYAGGIAEGTDTDNLFSGYSVTKKVGTKGNVTRRNCTYAYHASNNNGTIYCHVVKDGSDYHCTWRQGSGASSTALTESKTFTAATSGTQTWAVASTNPEHSSNGGFLADGDSFISCTVAGGNLANSRVVDIAVPLPWGRGDLIYETATNTYGGKLLRFALEALGVTLPVDTGGTETITDP